jgi:hypothetical protein
VQVPGGDRVVESGDADGEALLLEARQCRHDEGFEVV